MPRQIRQYARKTTPKHTHSAALWGVSLFSWRGLQTQTAHDPPKKNSNTKRRNPAVSCPSTPPTHTPHTTACTARPDRPPAVRKMRMSQIWAVFCHFWLVFAHFADFWAGLTQIRSYLRQLLTPSARLPRPRSHNARTGFRHTGGSRNHAKPQTATPHYRPKSTLPSTPDLSPG